MGVTVKGVQKTKRNFDQFERDSQKSLERDLARASITTRNELVRHMSQTRRRDDFLGVLSGTGDNLVRRRGATVKRLSPGGSVQVIRTGRSIITQSSVGSPDPHMDFLEEGGTKAPPGGNSIPLAPHQTPAGADRFPFGARNIPGAFIYPTDRMLHPKSGQPKRAYPKDRYLVRPKNGSLEFLRLFKDRVHIRGRHLFRNAISVARRDLPTRLNVSMRSLVREANR